MNAAQDREELLDLVDALCDGAIAPAEHERLQRRLATDVAARRLYFDYLDLRLHLRQWQRASLGERAACKADVPGPIPPNPIVIQTSPSTHPPLAMPYSQLGGLALSYVAATLIVGIGLLIGWAYQVSLPQSSLQDAANLSPRSVVPAVPASEAVFVGQITGMVDCQWVDPRTAPVGFDKIVLGRQYALASGLMEISYDTGAKIILQGPCTYQVESRTGGYLSLGKLTARVDAKGGRQKAEGGSNNHVVKSPDLQISKSPNPDSPLHFPPSPLFSVRTPTAIVTDLGTEFGVEVETSGGSRAYVYRGKVELRVADDRGAGSNAKATPLGENESARVEVGKDRAVKVVRQPARPGEFVRRMPKRIPIKLFNTGVNLKVGDPDPHWQLVARSDDAKFRPCPAVVIRVGDDPRYLANQADRSQWVSAVVDSVMPDNVAYTFRTSFDLTGARAPTAVLHGRFVADNHVQAIRLNGRPLRVIMHGHEEFGLLHAFSAERGFVEGVNVLEIDVENGDPRDNAPRSAMGVLVELNGSALSSWPAAGENAAIDARDDQSRR
jgi:hypothetical protein